MEPVILRSQRARERSRHLCEQAQRLRRRAQEAVEHATAVWHRAERRLSGRKSAPSVRRFVVCVRRIYVRNLILERGDVLTDAILGEDTEGLLARGIVREGDFDLTELRCPIDPWDDGRWMG